VVREIESVIFGDSGDRGCDLCHILFEDAVRGGESKEIMNILN